MLKCIVATSTCEHRGTTNLDVCRPLAEACRDHLFLCLSIRLFLSDPWTAPWSEVEKTYEVLEHRIWRSQRDMTGGFSELCMATRGGVPRRYRRRSTVSVQVVP